MGVRVGVCVCVGGGGALPHCTHYTVHGTNQQTRFVV